MLQILNMICGTSFELTKLLINATKNYAETLIGNGNLLLTMVLVFGVLKMY